MKIQLITSLSSENSIYEKAKRWGIGLLGFMLATEGGSVATDWILGLPCPNCSRGKRFIRRKWHVILHLSVSVASPWTVFDILHVLSLKLQKFVLDCWSVDLVVAGCGSLTLYVRLHKGLYIKCFGDFRILLRVFSVFGEIPKKLKTRMQTKFVMSVVL